MLPSPAAKPKKKIDTEVVSTPYGDVNQRPGRGGFGHVTGGRGAPKGDYASMLKAVKGPGESDSQAAQRLLATTSGQTVDTSHLDPTALQASAMFHQTLNVEEDRYPGFGRQEAMNQLSQIAQSGAPISSFQQQYAPAAKTQVEQKVQAAGGPPKAKKTVNIRCGCGGAGNGAVEFTRSWKCPSCGTQHKVDAVGNVTTT